MANNDPTFITSKNIRQSIELTEASSELGVERKEANALLQRVNNEIDDSIMALSGGGLHPEAVAHLKEARRRVTKKHARKRIDELENARAQLIDIPLQRTQK